MPYEPFKTRHPNYLGYSSDQYEVASIPDGVVEGLKGLLDRFCDVHFSYHSAIDFLRTRVPMGPATNSRKPWLDGDLNEALRELSNKPLHKFMDAIGELRQEIRSADFNVALEELLDEENFGYYIESDGPLRYWTLRDDYSGKTVQVVEVTIQSVADICRQSAEHLEQTMSHLKRDDERSRKDAVRDALSAVEALYKSLSGEDDIVPAWKKLREQKTWGPVEIVKDGFQIWSTVQELYRDIRHGQASSSSISHEEATYWIERSTVFIRHMASRAPK